MLDDRWKQELNVDNPLGMRGEVAMSYAELIKILWCGKYSYTIPRNFKVCIAVMSVQTALTAVILCTC